MKEKEKIHIKQKPQVTDEEIRKAMDFESVLKKSRVESAAGFKFDFSKLNLNSVLIASSAIVAVSSYFILKKDGEIQLAQKNTDSTHVQLKPNIDIKPPAVARASNKIETSAEQEKFLSSL
ncbi:MAG: hypothetical protein QM734_08840 [Cyclobacteriaceae bacterium]